MSRGLRAPLATGTASVGGVGDFRSVELIIETIVAALRVISRVSSLFAFCIALGQSCNDATCLPAGRCTNWSAWRQYVLIGSFECAFRQPRRLETMRISPDVPKQIVRINC